MVKKRRVRRWGRELLLGIFALVVVVVVAVALYLSMGGSGGVPTTAKPKALVADSLMLDYPNPDLIEHIVGVLKSAGYEVDVVTGRDVNLTLYSRLTDYDLVILRVHGGRALYRTPDGKLHRLNGLFTGVPWSEEYRPLKRAWLATRAFPYNSTKAFVAALPKFFDVMLSGKFRPGSVMIVASCFSLYTSDIADALARKGLSMFIGWEGPVTLNHMDRVLRRLVDYAVGEGVPWPEAVKRVNEELGPDPTYGEPLKIVIYWR